MGVEYDNLGRITALPGEYAGGGKLSTSYFVNDLTRSQTQDGITNTYELDASLRQRQRTREGGGEEGPGAEEGTAIYHYAGGSDSPAWTEEGEAWTRSIGALGGSLGALQQSNGDLTFQIVDMHGDVIATADDGEKACQALRGKVTAKFRTHGNRAHFHFSVGGQAACSKGTRNRKLSVQFRGGWTHRGVPHETPIRIRPTPSQTTTCPRLHCDHTAHGSQSVSVPCNHTVNIVVAWTVRVSWTTRSGNRRHDEQTFYEPLQVTHSCE